MRERPESYLITDLEQDRNHKHMQGHKLGQQLTEFCLLDQIQTVYWDLIVETGANQDKN